MKICSLQVEGGCRQAGILTDRFAQPALTDASSFQDYILPISDCSE